MTGLLAWVREHRGGAAMLAAPFVLVALAALAHWGFGWRR